MGHVPADILWPYDIFHTVKKPLSCQFIYSFSPRTRMQSVLCQVVVMWTFCQFWLFLYWYKLQWCVHMLKSCVLICWWQLFHAIIHLTAFFNSSKWSWKIGVINIADRYRGLILRSKNKLCAYLIFKYVAGNFWNYWYERY